MKKHFIQVSYWLALMLPFSLPGQSSVLDEYVAQALANNLNLQTFALSQARQLSKVEQAKKLWQPNLDLNTSYLFAEGGRTIVFPVGDLFNPVYGALNRLTASQSFPEDLENFETQLTPNNYLDASLSVSKPIVNSAIKYNILIQQALVQLSQVDQDIQLNEIAFQVKQAYYNLLKTYQGQTILEENKILLQDVLEFNKKLIKYDKVTPDAISDVEYQLAIIDSEIQNLNEQKRLAQVLFNTLLNRDLNTAIELDTGLLNYEIIDIYNLDESITKAINSRPEFRKLTIANDVNELNVKRINGKKHPTLSVRGAIGLQAEEFSFDDGGPLYTIGLSLGWNLYDGGLRKKEIDELKIEKEQNDLEEEIVKQQITLQVAQAFYNLRSVYADLAAEDAAIRAAIISHDAIKKRYENEKALLIELLSAQNRLTTSKLNRVLAAIDILILKADLDRIVYEN